jgi:hypothetical protein
VPDLSPSMAGRVEASSSNEGRNPRDTRPPKLAKPLKPSSGLPTGSQTPSVDLDKDEKHQLDERA